MGFTSFRFRLLNPKLRDLPGPSPPLQRYFSTGRQHNHSANTFCPLLAFGLPPLFSIPASPAHSTSFVLFYFSLAERLHPNLFVAALYLTQYLLFWTRAGGPRRYPSAKSGCARPRRADSKAIRGKGAATTPTSRTTSSSASSTPQLASVLLVKRRECRCLPAHFRFNTRLDKFFDCGSVRIEHSNLSRRMRRFCNGTARSGHYARSPMFPPICPFDNF